MAREKVIGIDLGTTNSCVAHRRGRHARRHPQPRRLQDHAVDGGDRRDRQAPRRSHRQAAGDHQRREHGLRGQAPDRPQVELAAGAERRSRPCRYRIVEGPHDDVRIVLRDKVLQRPGDQRDDPAGDEDASPRSTSASEVTKAVVTVPAYFNDDQRQATKDAGAHRRPRRHPHHQRADRGRARLRLRQATSSARSRSTTSAAARSTSRSSRSAHGVFEVIATAGDTFLGGEDFDAPHHRLAGRAASRSSTTSICARTGWRCSA